MSKQLLTLAAASVFCLSLSACDKQEEKKDDKKEADAKKDGDAKKEGEGKDDGKGEEKKEGGW